MLCKPLDVIRFFKNSSLLAHFLCFLRLSSLTLLFCGCILAPLNAHHEDAFIANRKELKRYYQEKQLVMIASPGRSGSTMLTDIVKEYAVGYTVLKTHLLPPSTQFKGKILFIYSNPDKAAESALHKLLLSKSGGKTHFSHVESADQRWFDRIGRHAKNQTEEHNFLSYDALGCHIQLEQWLHKKTRACSIEEGQILAIKLEHLWDEDAVEAIKQFLHLQTFNLPLKQERGCDTETSIEIKFKQLYNEGTEKDPKYPAYDKARTLWEEAPPFLFLKLSR